MDLNTIINDLGHAIDFLGVTIIVTGVVVGSLGVFRHDLRDLAARSRAYQSSRRVIGRSVLFGLEILVAGDIIRTVATTPTLESVGVLAGIVAIRTFLSWSLEVEISGRWPWQSNLGPLDEKRS